MGDILTTSCQNYGTGTNGKITGNSGPDGPITGHTPTGGGSDC